MEREKFEKRRMEVLNEAFEELFSSFDVLKTLVYSFHYFLLIAQWILVISGFLLSLVIECKEMEVFGMDVCEILIVYGRSF